MSKHMDYTLKGKKEIPQLIISFYVYATTTKKKKKKAY